MSTAHVRCLVCLRGQLGGMCPLASTHGLFGWGCCPPWFGELVRRCGGWAGDHRCLADGHHPSSPEVLCTRGPQPAVGCKLARARAAGGQAVAAGGLARAAAVRGGAALRAHGHALPAVHPRPPAGARAGRRAGSRAALGAQGGALGTCAGPPAAAGARIPSASARTVSRHLRAAPPPLPGRSLLPVLQGARQPRLGPAGCAPAAPGPCRVRPPPASAPRPGPRPGRTARAQGELAKAGDDVPEHLRVALPPDAPRGALGAVLERSRRLCLARYEKERFCERAYLDHYRRSRELHLSPEQLAVYAGAPLAVPNPSPIPVSASCMSRGAPTEPLLPVRPWLSLTLAPSLCRPPACRGVLLLSLCWGAHVCARWGVLQIARFLMRVLQLREDRQDKQGHRILMSGRQCRFKFACASWLRAARA